MDTRCLHRGAAENPNRFPECRDAVLDIDLLENLGLTPERVENKDELFFQLILLMCNAYKSGICGDPRRNYYSNIEKDTCKNSDAIWAESSHDHSFNAVKIKELVKFDGVLVRNSVLDSINGALHRIWIKGSNFDKDTGEEMNHSRWLQIKCVLHLNDNDVSIARGEEGYDPEQKFDLVLKYILHNCSTITKHDSTDLTLYKITWTRGCYVLIADGLMKMIESKPNATKASQLSMACDVKSLLPRACVRRHELHQQEGYTQEVPREMKMMFDQLGEFFIGNTESNASSNSFHVI